MRIKFLSLGLICFFLILCKSPFMPELPKLNANIVLDGTLNRTYNYYGSPQFEGYVKNIGNRAGYMCKVEIQCFYGLNKVDIAIGYPGNWENIYPGQRVYFKAIIYAFDCNSHEDIKSYNIEITWLNEEKN